jgi:hypothetical protein
MSMSCGYPKRAEQDLSVATIRYGRRYVYAGKAYARSCLTMSCEVGVGRIAAGSRA